MTDNDDLKWYVAQLKPNGFDRAVANLARQGFASFMPVQNRTVRHARQLKNVLRPVFPGYLFVQFGAERSDWRKINSTSGITKLISFGQAGPAAVPQDLVDGLLTRCDGQGVMQPLDDLQEGERVKLLSGAFSEFVGQVETLVGDESVRVLLEIMGQASRVDVPRDGLERL